MSKAVVFEEPFVVIEQADKVYLRVTRVKCRSLVSADLDLAVDINTEVFPIDIGQKPHLTIALVTTIEKSDSLLPDKYDPSIYQRETRMDDYDYVMFGRCFECNCDDPNATKLSAVLSFGGLLMKVEGTAKSLRDIVFNKQYYLMIRKV